MVDFSTIDKGIATVLEARMRRLRDDISDRINSMGIRASGKTQASMRVEVSSNEVALWGRKFFASMQYGSRYWTGYTGIRCSFEEFREIIRQWASDKGLHFGQAREHERTIGAIAATIIRQGTRLFRSHGYQDVYDTLIAEALKDFQIIVLDKVSTEFNIAINQWARKSITITI